MTIGKMPFRKRYDVRAHEVDPAGRPAISAVGYWLQDAAGEHARQLGASIEEMTRQGRTWVLTRLQIRLLRPLQWGDTVQVETWPAGVRPRLAYRDFELRLDSGDLVGRAVSTWMVLDLATWHPVHIPEFIKNFPQPARSRGDDELDRLAPPPLDAPSVMLRVDRRDLDINRHANNVSYFGWLAEAVPDAIWQGSWLAQFDIGYRAEGRCGDQLQSRCGAVDGAAGTTTFAHSLVRASDGVELALGRSVWTEHH